MLLTSQGGKKRSRLFYGQQEGIDPDCLEGKVSHHLNKKFWEKRSIAQEETT